jgi:hypothetical protein
MIAEYRPSTFPLPHLWGGPPDLRPTSSQQTGRFVTKQEAGQGAGRGPGGPPHTASKCRRETSVLCGDLTLR